VVLPGRRVRTLALPPSPSPSLSPILPCYRLSPHSLLNLPPALPQHPQGPSSRQGRASLGHQGETARDASDVRRNGVSGAYCRSCLPHMRADNEALSLSLAL
jgi:hypothetical protein